MKVLIMGVTTGSAGSAAVLPIRVVNFFFVCKKGNFLFLTFQIYKTKTI